jgi:hypothetical protein
MGMRVLVCPTIAATVMTAVFTLRRLIGGTVARVAMVMARVIFCLCFDGRSFNGLCFDGLGFDDLGIVATLTIRAARPAFGCAGI